MPEIDAKSDVALRGYETDLTSAFGYRVDFIMEQPECIISSKLCNFLGKLGIEPRGIDNLAMEARDAFDQGRRKFLLIPKEQCTSDPQDAAAVLAAAGQDQEEDITEQVRLICKSGAETGQARVDGTTPLCIAAHTRIRRRPYKTLKLRKQTMLATG